MADKQIPEVLADLPEDWGYEQIVAPDGVSVGLTPQHGYNYLMKKVNECARTLNQIIVEMGQIAPDDMVTANGGGELLLPVILGGGPYEIEFTEEETSEYALKSDLSAYATKDKPNFTGYISLKRKSGSPAGNGSIAIGEDNEASGFCSCAFGVNAAAAGVYAFVCGFETRAAGLAAHAEGNASEASGNSSHAEGFACTASGDYSHAEGSMTEASGKGAHSEGSGCTASGDWSHSEGLNCKAKGEGSHAGGGWTKAGADYQTVVGVNNKESQSETDRFIVGNGEKATFIGAVPSNCFRVADSGVYGGEYHSSGADYAEIYEWADGNPDAEDRVGRFVVLDGENIRLASPGDDIRDVLGIVSGHPSIVGDSHDDQWRGMYLRDVFGRLVYEDAEVEDPEHPGQTHIERRRKLNPAYDPAQAYIPQSKRPEKSAVGLLGKLVVIDDGTCEVNGWCAAGSGGTATKSETRTRFRVMSRLDETHIRVNIMMQ